jgi:hypothetical protein
MDFKKKSNQIIEPRILKNFHIHAASLETQAEGLEAERGGLISAEVILTDQILSWSEKDQSRLQMELDSLFHEAFPKMPAKEREDWLSVYFTKPGRRFCRQTILCRDSRARLVATSIFDCGEIEYGGGIFEGIYLITTAILPDFQNFGLGQTLGATILMELQPDILLTTCAQSTSLHSRIGLTRKGLVTGFTVYPRLEEKDGIEVLVAVPDDQREFAISVFRQLFLNVVHGKQEDVEKAVRNLTPLMVRKNLYPDMFHYDPWQKDGREDRLAKALRVNAKDGVLVIFKKKD